MTTYSLPSGPNWIGPPMCHTPLGIPSRRTSIDPPELPVARIRTMRVYAASKVPETAAAGRDSTTVTDRRKKRTRIAARDLGDRSRIRPRSRPLLSVVFDAPRDTGCILLAGRCPRTTAPSEPPAGEVVETEGGDDREEFADEVKHPSELGEGEQSDQVHREAREGDEVVGQESTDERLRLDDPSERPPLVQGERPEDADLDGNRRGHEVRNPREIRQRPEQAEDDEGAAEADRRETNQLRLPVVQPCADERAEFRAEDLRHRAKAVDFRRAGTRPVGGRHFDLTVSRDARPRGEFEPEVVPRISHAPGDGLGDLRPHDAKGTRHILRARVEQQAFEAAQDPRRQGAVERLGPVGPPGLHDVRHARLEFGPEAFEVPRIILTVTVEEQEERELFRVDRENRVADRSWIALAIRGRRHAEGWHRFRDFAKHLAGVISTSVLEYE